MRVNLVLLLSLFFILCSFLAPLFEVLQDLISILKHLLSFDFLLGGVNHLLLEVLLQLQEVVVLIEAGDRVDNFFVVALLLKFVVLIYLVEKLLEPLIVLNVAWIKLLLELLFYVEGFWRFDFRLGAAIIG